MDEAKFANDFEERTKANPELAREAGRKGGHISKRGKAKKKPANSEPMARGAETAKKWRKEIEEYERIYG